MGLETGTYIDELNASWPLGSDKRRFGAHHLRLIKLVIKNTFPNIDAEITLTPAELNQLSGVDLGALNAITLGGEAGSYYLDLTNATGSLADARLPESAVTQHQDAFVLLPTQITPQYTNSDATASFTVGDGHAETIRRFTGACTVTLPNTIPANWQVGQSFGAIRAVGATVAFTCPGGTIRSSGGNTIAVENGKAFAMLAASGVWELGGNV